MSTTGRPAPPPSSVPTLTEVVSLPAGSASPPSAPAPAPAPGDWTGLATAASVATAPPAVPQRPATAAPAPSEAEVAQRLLAEIQQQLDLAIDVRLREALAPVLARAADAMVRDARKEMAVALRAIVARAVEIELGKRRGR